MRTSLTESDIRGMDVGINYSVRMECVDKNHNKFYTIHVVRESLDQWRVYAEYGRIGCAKPQFYFRGQFLGIHNTPLQTYSASYSMTLNKSKKGYHVVSVYYHTN